jgi:hypothetical protein
MKTVNYKKSNGTTGHIQINDDEEIVVVSKEEAQELNTNAEQPLLNPGLITNESQENVEADPEIVDEILNRNVADEEPLLPTEVRAE